MPNKEELILEKAFQLLAGGCSLTKEEREVLEKLDDLIKSADIIVSKDGSSATIATSSGSYQVSAFPNGGIERKKENGFEKEFNPLITKEDANAEAKILDYATKILQENGEHTRTKCLTDTELALIEKMDDILVHADIVINEREKKTIIQDDGKTYTNNFNSFNKGGRSK